MKVFCQCGCGREIPPAPPGQGGRKKKWATDRCRKAFWDEAHGAPCSECGKGWLPANVFRRNPRAKCLSCERAQRRAAHEQRLQLVAQMYNEGRLTREIAEALCGPSDLPLEKQGQCISPLLDVARKRGLIGYRVAEDDGRRRAAA